MPHLNNEEPEGKELDGTIKSKIKDGNSKVVLYKSLDERKIKIIFILHDSKENIYSL